MYPRWGAEIHEHQPKPCVATPLQQPHNPACKPPVPSLATGTHLPPSGYEAPWLALAEEEAAKETDTAKKAEES
ncbi:hypothetical protein CYMTET_22813 [Cymbomonas tetramitiformis]|uniref:Uncharacterized protein n=1 Tax=Cymbomonas tetramitiformis TaxID=36881 RepID=A0AAE0L1R0_9CHLO|nr:hypothetical protein CYMTET_22813 [Cymbomonas tetramitiformis]